MHPTVVQTKKIKILQANLQRKPRAHDMAMLAVRDLKVDILVASEPNKKIVSSGKWLRDEKDDVAILLINRDIQVMGVKANKGHITIDLGDFTVTCCYISPNTTYEVYVEHVEEVMSEDGGGRERIILGDINAKSPRWDSPVWDRRGEWWTEWLDSKDMVVLNHGGKPTWRRGDQKSYIDVTCATRAIAGEISEWSVRDEESLSDHAFIYFTVKGGRRRNTPEMGKRAVVDAVILRDILSEGFARLEQQTPTAVKLVAIMKNAQDRATIRGRDGRPGLYPYWWNADIDGARKTCFAAKRRLARARTRAMGTNALDEILTEYRESRKALSRLIRTSKKQHWEDIRRDLEEDIWGKGYQIVTRDIRKKHTPYELSDDKKLEIASILFPTVEDGWVATQGVATDIPGVTTDEVIAAAERLKKKRSPGPDGITPETVQEAVRIAPGIFARVLEDLLKAGTFPSPWKIARLVLIWKGKMPIENATSQRPLCLTDTTGKLLEQVIKERLLPQWEGRDGLSERQFGFRKGRSTIKAAEFVQTQVSEARGSRLCALITIDIRNAFNTARWSHIIGEMQSRNTDGYLIRIVEDYFRGRKITVGRETLAMTTGVPQGSVLGPLLWNIMYDGILRVALPDGAKTVAFADDLAIFVKANRVEEVESKGNVALHRIGKWLRDHSLELAPEKTEAIFLKGYRKKLEAKFKIRGHDIVPRKTLTYLGIILDVQNTYGVHVQEKCRKAEERATALGRLMPNIGGPSMERRRMYHNVIQSIILYAAPVWGGALRIKRHAERVQRTQRGAICRVAMAYRTVSTAALQVLTGIPPMDLMVEERCRIHQSGEGHLRARRREERAATLRRWQDRWDNESRVAQWTKSLIPDVTRWYNCSFRKLNYFLTQFFTGHGSFGAYLHRIGKAVDGECRHCGAAEDSPQHAVLQCPRWVDVRGTLLDDLGRIEHVGDVVAKMLTTPERWKSIADPITAIIKEKEELERRAENGR